MPPIAAIVRAQREDDQPDPSTVMPARRAASALPPTAKM